VVAAVEVDQAVLLVLLELVAEQEDLEKINLQLLLTQLVL
jgi:hypothetical protein